MAEGCREEIGLWICHPLDMQRVQNQIDEMLGGTLSHINERYFSLIFSMLAVNPDDRIISWKAEMKKFMENPSNKRKLSKQGPRKSEHPIIKKFK